jgi:transposase-like protein
MNKIESKKWVKFSEAFKKEKVSKIEKGEVTVRQLSKIYKVSQTAIYNWRNKYGSLPKGEQMVIEKESEGAKTISLMNKVAELERFIGSQQVELSYLKKVLEFGSKTVSFDIEKKFKQR